MFEKSVLQEAIQGKLVPQIAEEGTAHELLEQIKAEKQKLVKEGKLKKSALASSVIFRGDDNKYWEKKGTTCECIDEDIPLMYRKVGLGYVWKQSLIQAPLVEFMQRTGDKREYHSIEREKLANWLMMVLLITNYT